MSPEPAHNQLARPIMTTNQAPTARHDLAQPVRAGSLQPQRPSSGGAAYLPPQRHNSAERELPNTTITNSYA